MIDKRLSCLLVGTLSVSIFNSSAISIASDHKWYFSGFSEQIDVVFALDGSRDVDINLFNKMKEFMKGSLKAYNISTNETRIAVMTYGNKQLKNVDLKDGIYKSVIEQVIEDAKRAGGERRLIDALKFADMKMFEKTASSSRDETAGKVLILMMSGSDSQIDKGNELKMVLDELNRKKITLVVIGVGNKVKDGDLKKIGKDGNVVKVEDPADLKRALPPVLDASGKATGI